MKNLIDKIKKLSKNNQEYEIETLIEQKLKEEPENIEWWLRLAVLDIDPPIVDDPKSISCAQKVLSLDPDNATATLLLAFFLDYSSGSINQELANKLMTMQTGSCTMDSMLRYAASWFYSRNDNRKKEEQLLKESIKLYGGHVWNYIYLARLYLKDGRIIQARRLAKRALQNVKKIYGNEYDEDPTDIDTFLNERIKGIEITDINYESIQEEFGVTHNFGEEQ